MLFRSLELHASLSVSRSPVDIHHNISPLPPRCHRPLRASALAFMGQYSSHPSRRRKRGSGEHHADHPESEGGGGVKGMFDGAMAGNPVLMMTSMAM